MQNGEKNALQVYLQGCLFLLFYRATALQRGKSFPSCAWRMPLLHRGFFTCFRTRFSWFDHIFTTTAYGLHHSRYGFWQIHFRFLINMIIDIHCDLCIWMVFAPLRSVLNGCPPDIQPPITYCITLGLTLFSPNLVHPVWRRVCGCVKYRTKKFYFFLPKTIWRSNFVLTYPPGPPPTIIIS